MYGSSGNYPVQSDEVNRTSGPVIDIADIVGIVRRRWLLPVIGCLIGLALAVTYIVMVPELYRARARILIDRSVNRYLQVNKIVDEPTFDDIEVGSQIYILSSESIILPVVRALNLASDPEFVGRPKSATDQVTGLDKLKALAKKTLGVGGSPVTSRCIRRNSTAGSAGGCGVQPRRACCSDTKASIGLRHQAASCSSGTLGRTRARTAQC